MSENSHSSEVARLRLLRAVIQKNLVGAVEFLADFSNDRRPFDRLASAWGELNSESPRVAAAMHDGIRDLERCLPSDPDRVMDEYRSEMNARAELVPEGTEMGHVFEASEKEIAKLQELRPEDFTE